MRVATTPVVLFARAVRLHATSHCAVSAMMLATLVAAPPNFTGRRAQTAPASLSAGPSKSAHCCNIQHTRAHEAAVLESPKARLPNVHVCSSEIDAVSGEEITQRVREVTNDAKWNKYAWLNEVDANSGTHSDPYGDAKGCEAG